MIEGHVPSAEVKKLLKAGHDIDGLAVPGMPAGSPGMDMGPRKDAYKVIAFKGIKAAEFASYWNRPGVRTGRRHLFQVKPPTDGAYVPMSHGYSKWQWKRNLPPPNRDMVSFINSRYGMSGHAQRTEELVKILGELLVSIGIEDFYVGEDIECSRVCAISTSYPKHTHEEYIISANLKGIESVWVDNKDYVVPAGHVTVYNPMAIQSSQFCSDGVEFISLHINPETIKKVAIDNNIAHRDSYPLLQQGALKNVQIFRAIQECYLTARSSTEYKEESILWLLATLLEEDKPVTGRKRHSVNMAINNMKDCLDGKIDLSSLASSVGLSKYHFVRVFRQEVGIAPVQYHMQLRLIEARRMIRDGIRPIDVMADLGFYDQSHFINTFRKVMAMTPDLYYRSQEIKLS